MGTQKLFAVKRMMLDWAEREINGNLLIGLEVKAIYFCHVIKIEYIYAYLLN